MDRAFISEDDYAGVLLRSLNGQRRTRRQTAAQSKRAPPEILPGCASGALRAIRTLLNQDPRPGIHGADLLTERAAQLGLPSPGQVSANRSCHLLRTGDDWLALNLARDEDWSLLPAWLEHQDKLTDLDTVARLVVEKYTDPLVSRGRLMGLPVAGRGSAQQAENWFTRHPGPSRPARERRRQPLVIDLSSLWAGPLCSHLLERSGAKIIRVESSHRPDPTRMATPAFFESLNQNKQTVTVDFHSRRGARALHNLLSKADIVIEASRPRALTQLGIDAEALVQARAGRIWLSITAYGRHPPNADWVGFGDDVAIAAGAARTTANGPAFFSDAVADPLTGLHAALAVIYHWQSGLGGLLDISLYAVTAWCLAHGRGPDAREANKIFDNPAGTQKCC